MLNLSFMTVLRGAVLTVCFLAGIAVLSETCRAQGAKNDAATIEEAAKVLDLRKLSLPAMAEPSGDRQLSSMTYNTSEDPKAAYKFHQEQLVKAGWTELPGTSLDAAYAAGSFQKSGYTLSITTTMIGEGKTMVALNNHGNVALSSLPVVKGAESVFANAITAIYSTKEPVEKVTAATKELLTKAGWTSYGENNLGDEQKIFNLKKNAILLNVMISVAPAQNNQTSIMMNVSLMSADLPAPADAKELQFTPMFKTLSFQTAMDYEAVGKFYQTELAKQGWKSTAPEIAESEDDFGRPQGLMVFRNKAEDMITLELKKLDEVTDVTIKHQTKEEWKEEEERAKEAIKNAQAAEEEAVAAAGDEEMEESELARQIREEAEMEVEKALGDANAQIAEALKGIPGRSEKPKASSKKNADKKPAAKPSTKAMATGKESSVGTLKVGDKTYTLKNIVAYEIDYYGDKMTRVYLSEKPANITKLKASLARERSDNEFNEFQPQVRLIINADGMVESYDLWADNVSVSGNGSLEGSAELKGGRIIGNAKLTEEGEAGDRKYMFDFKFEANVIPLPEKAGSESDSDSEKEDE